MLDIIDSFRESSIGCTKIVACITNFLLIVLEYYINVMFFVLYTRIDYNYTYVCLLL